MAITIIPLDNSHEKDFPTILVGKDVFLMIKPTKSLIDNNVGISDLIKQTDLLLEKSTLSDLRKLQTLTDKIERRAISSIELADYSEKLDISILKEMFKKEKTTMLESATEIAKIEDRLQLYLADTHDLSFCNNCSAYVGLMTEGLPEECRACGETIIRDIEKSEKVRYLVGKVRNYLQGIWFQDYLAKVLNNMGWEVWVECEVMGSAGVYHPIDILALKDGKIVIIECKRTPKGDDAFKLAVRFFDIHPSFGVLASFNELESKHGKSLLSKTSGLKFLKMGNISDEEIKRLFDACISGEN